MTFGVFYELQLARSWAADGEPRLYNDALDQIELADRLGYDDAWAVERVSALGLVSNGRVELGMGESASVTELHPFGVRRQVGEARCRRLR